MSIQKNYVLLRSAKDANEQTCSLHEEIEALGLAMIVSSEHEVFADYSKPIVVPNNEPKTITFLHIYVGPTSQAEKDKLTLLLGSKERRDCSYVLEDADADHILIQAPACRINGITQFVAQLKPGPVVRTALPRNDTKPQL